MSEKTLRRVFVSELDEILGDEIPVLDKGFIRVIDYMGSDESIVQAARQSYGAGTKQVREDEKLIRYLMRHKHTTPFEMCEIKLHVRVPMDCWRQWIRHRTASVNEYSTRYSEAIDDMQSTQSHEWRGQSKSNRQGSEDCISSEAAKRLTEEEGALQAYARGVYVNRLVAGVAREQARKDLPLSTYTEAYWKIDLHNLLHFLQLRLDQHAQYEIRQYASAIAEIVEKWCPVTWKAFEDYRLSAITLSPAEMSILRAALTGDTSSIRRVCSTYDWTLKSRELKEADVKFRRLGMPLEWLAFCDDNKET